MTSFFSISYYFPLWQKFLFAHPLQPQEQELLPFFLFIIPLTTIATNTIPTITATTIVCQVMFFLLIF